MFTVKVRDTKIVCEITEYIVHWFSIRCITTLSFENKISLFMGSI